MIGSLMRLKKAAIAAKGAPVLTSLTVALVTAFTIVIVFWRLAVSDLEDANQKIGEAKQAFSQQAAALKSCNFVVEQQKAASAHNYRLANEAEIRARQAESEILQLQLDAADREKEIANVASQIRNADSGECRKLTDDLPAEFLDWVWSDPAANNH